MTATSISNAGTPTGIVLSHEQSIDVVVLDFNMPGMCLGKELNVFPFREISRTLFAPE